MDGGLESMWLMDFCCSHFMTGVAIWFSNLTHLLSCVWFLWDLTYGFSVCLTCIGGHSFSHRMNTHEAFVRFDGFLDSFSCGLGWVHGHVLEIPLLVHDFVLVMLLVVLLILSPWDLVGFLMIASLISSSLYLTTCFLVGLNDFFLLTKFCILLTLMINWVYLYCIQVLGSQVFID
jgi:hypothetical protein